MIKIFQIGLHICGTRSLAEFFAKNNFKTFHHENHKLAEQLFTNLKDGKTHFDEELEPPFYKKQGVFYSDMQSFKPNRDKLYKRKLEGYTLFKEIDKGYPGSLFILNTRNDWVNSKMQKKGFKKYTNYKNNDELRQILKNEHDTHLKNVREYFKNRENFIEFNIQNDKIHKLIEWLKKHGVEIKYEKLRKIRG